MINQRVQVRLEPSLVPRAKAKTQSAKESPAASARHALVARRKRHVPLDQRRRPEHRWWVVIQRRDRAARLRLRGLWWRADQAGHREMFVATGEIARHKT